MSHRKNVLTEGGYKITFLGDHPQSIGDTKHRYLTQLENNTKEYLKQIRRQACSSTVRKFTNSKRRRAAMCNQSFPKEETGFEIDKGLI